MRTMRISFFPWVHSHQIHSRLFGHYQRHNNVELSKIEARLLLCADRVWLTSNNHTHDIIPRIKIMLLSFVSFYLFFFLFLSFVRCVPEIGSHNSIPHNNYRTTCVLFALSNLLSSLFSMPFIGKFNFVLFFFLVVAFDELVYQLDRMYTPFVDSST